MAKRKAHVIEERGATGGFHVERFIRCRCGWRADHYAAARLLGMFRAHQAEQEEKHG